MQRQGDHHPRSWIISAVRAGIVLSIAIVLLGASGCMAELQTSRPAAVRPSPPLSVPTPVEDTAGQVTPEETRQLAPETTSLPEASTLPAETTTPATDLPPLTATPSTITRPASPAISGNVIVPATAPSRSSQERWRNEQQDRSVFETPQTYITSGSELWWYDPVNQQHLLLGSFAGTFDVQATFTLPERGEALEVPYKVNQRYGLTSLSPAILDRIAAAGYGEWIETYVLVTPAVRPL